MNVNLFQIVTCILFSIFIFRYVKKAVSLFDYAVIFIIYILFNFILFDPYILKDISSFFGIGRGVDLFLYASIFVLFFTVIQLLLKIEKNREDISTLNRKISIILSQKNND
jgi:hypothetical protein